MLSLNLLMYHNVTTIKVKVIIKACVMSLQSIGIHCLIHYRTMRESKESMGEYIYRVREPPGSMEVIRLRKRM